jgi:hypothetical protein
MDWSGRSERCDLSRLEFRQERGADPAVMPARRRYVCDNAHIHTGSSGLDQRLHGTQTRPEAVSGSAARAVNRFDYKGGCSLPRAKNSLLLPPGSQRHNGERR